MIHKLRSIEISHKVKCGHCKAVHEEHSQTSIDGFVSHMEIVKEWAFIGDSWMCEECQCNFSVDMSNI